ncbi:hypothetical protein [Ureibacillus terrenus]|uniref:hypothetical protein n=1 Tax=Ureibacillus terrenus TaxID=118246 RepID=UPI002E1EFEA7|nr:hypothetical protein [Ureibacillus terrenus]
MELSAGIVAFLDILGYKNMVLQDSKNSKLIYLPIIEEMLNSLNPILNNRGLEIRQFSDSIVISAKYSIENTLSMLNAVSDVQWYMFKNGILLRGGIALGRHYSNGNIMYSEGLIEAYNLESNYARVPRILVDDNLLELVLGTCENPIEIKEFFKKKLLKDKDSRNFVNYVDMENLEIHEQQLKEMLMKVNLDHPSLIEKYEWLVNYHNFLLEKKGEQKRNFKIPKITHW